MSDKFDLDRRDINFQPEAVRLTVKMQIRYAPSSKQVEDLLHGAG